MTLVNSALLSCTLYGFGLVTVNGTSFDPVGNSPLTVMTETVRAAAVLAVTVPEPAP